MKTWKEIKTDRKKEEQQNISQRNNWKYCKLIVWYIERKEENAKLKIIKVS